MLVIFVLYYVAYLSWAEGKWDMPFLFDLRRFGALFWGCFKWLHAADCVGPRCIVNLTGLQPVEPGDSGDIGGVTAPSLNMQCVHSELVIVRLSFGLNASLASFTHEGGTLSLAACKS